MLGTANLTRYVEEGTKARAASLESFDNPYSFMREADKAYAWEEGYKRGRP